MYKDLNKEISKQLLSHVLGREVYGFCYDNDKKDKIIKTTCYMMYNNLDREDYYITKLELAYKIKEWIKNTSDEYEISSINIYSGFDYDKYEDGYFCILGQGWTKESTFYAEDEVLAIIKAGEFYLDKHYDLFLYKDKEKWK